MAVIPGVSNNELVRTTWGNSVATELNSNSVRRNGLNAAGTAAEQMTGPLLLPTTQSTNDVAAIHKGYADATYVDMAGDSMTGTLTITQNSLTLRLRGDPNTYMDFTDTAGTLKAFLQASAAGFNIASAADLTLFGTGSNIDFYTNNTFRGRWASSLLLLGKAASNVAEAGVEIAGGSSGFEGRMASTTSVAASPNLYLRHIGAASADGVAFVQFADAAGGILSHITQDAVAPAGVYFPNCTATAPSDYRLKNDLGPVVDPVDRFNELIPRHLSWRDGGAEFDGFYAHEVQAVVPNAVRGDKDDVYDEAEAEMMGVEAGTVKPQQLDQTALIPLLAAALQDALSTIADLTARVAALEAV